MSIPIRMRGIRLSNLKSTAGNKKAFDAANDFVNNASDYIKQGRGILLMGPPGTGKTALLCATLNEVSAKMKESPKDFIKYSNNMYNFETKDIEFESTFEFLRSRRKQMEKKDVETLADLKMRAVGIIGLDDLGAEYSTEWAKAEIAELIDLIYRNEISLFASTNCDEKVLTEQIGERSVDRLREMCVWRAVTCPSWRGQATDGK